MKAERSLTNHALRLKINNIFELILRLIFVLNFVDVLYIYVPERVALSHLPYLETLVFDVFTDTSEMTEEDELEISDGNYEIVGEEGIEMSNNVDDEIDVVWMKVDAEGPKYLVPLGYEPSMVVPLELRQYRDRRGESDEMSKKLYEKVNEEDEKDLVLNEASTSA